MRSTTLLTFMGGLILSSAVQAQPDLIRIDKSDGTWFKASTAQSSSLAADQKCELAGDDVMEYSDIAGADNNHLRVTLPRNYDGCGLDEGYLYQPHVSTHATTVTVLANTVFKREPLSSAELVDNDKCDLPAGMYRVSSSSDTASAHLEVNLASVPEGCSFSSGYLWEGHAAMGIQALTNRHTALIKTSTGDSSSLPDGETCEVPPGTTLLSAAPEEDEAGHYQVTLNSAPAGCGFRAGYIWYGQFNLAEPQPEPEGGDYAWPQPGSDLGSRWCVCRNIGTSPHIGQDFVQYGAKHAVAMEAGTITSITFSNSCGYFVNLTDRFGGIWRYVHLNRPAVSRGESVSRGQFLGNISQYPNSACGTGPHLHLERRSAGEFSDSATGRSCQNGYRTCYYDPMTPFGGSAFAQTTTQQMSTAYSPVETSRSTSNLATRECRSDPAQYPQAPRNGVGQYRTVAEDGLIRVSLSTTQTRTGRDNSQVVTAQVHLAGNPDNRCDLENGQDCIASWQVLAEKSDGDFARMFFEAGVHNAAVERVDAERYCSPEDATGRFDILINTAGGERYRVVTSPQN